MKKSLLLSLALGAMAMTASAATHNIYVANLTDWGSDVALYSWGDSEIFGGWPGATPDAQETISGVKYDKWVIDGHDGEVAHPILNNNNNGSQIDLNMITLDEENYYFATNGESVNQYSDPSKPETTFETIELQEGWLYLLDRTGWDNLAVYGWSTGQPEALGKWPGTEATESVTVADQTYKKVPFDGNGVTSYNLIFSHDGGGEGKQFDGCTAIAGKTTFIEVTATTATILPTPDIESGVKVVIEDDSEAEYYTLQGVRVAAPETGIYIVRKGSKVSKVVK